MTTSFRFTGKVDKRFAWLGNDATGSIDLEAQLVAFINSATTSIAVSSMTFTIASVAAALATAAAAGKTVRIVGNAGHRFQPGYLAAQAGPVQLIDNNHAALVTRISFQQGAASPGWLVDSGAVLGDRGNGFHYGWNTDVSADINPHSAPASFTSKVLGECYAKPNTVQRTWSIELPPGFYYVLAVTGEANFNSKSYVRAQGQQIFTYKSGGVLHYSDYTDCAAGEFKCSIVDGGTGDGTTLAQSARLDVTSGTLSVAVGQGSSPGSSYTSLDYIEIYRASDTAPLGDTGTDRTRVQERQLHHTKFILLDAGTPQAKLWTGSHNLTPVDSSGRSEDAVVTTDAAICAAFAQEFDQWWGSSSATPDPANSRFGKFKNPVVANGTMPSALLASSYSWKVRFSPSSGTAPGVNLSQVVSDHLNGASHDILMLLEQLNDGGNYNGFNGVSWVLNNVLDPKVAAGAKLLALLGNSDTSDSIFSRYSGDPDVAVAQEALTHDKMVLTDALRDTRLSAHGRVLCGSMNWSQSGMHVNNEQTLVLDDPALANQALQRAMAGYFDEGMITPEPADIVIVVDRSYSMNEPATASGTKIAAAKTAAATLVDLLTADGTHRVGIVKFGTDVELPHFPLTPLTSSSLGNIHTALDNIHATLPLGASTCYGLALQGAQSILTSAATPKPRRVVVFLTDGLENHAPMADGNWQTLHNTTHAEIHTTAFGPFDPFATGGANSILATMANGAMGTFAQVDTDAIHLQKRFAEVARDAMSMATLLDPSWLLGAGEAGYARIPVDFDRGLLKFCAFWGSSGANTFKLRINTPWGDVLSPTDPGVTRRQGGGRDVWLVDLRLLRKLNRGSVLGIWTVAAIAAKDGFDKKQRVDLAVYGSRAGADLRVEVFPYRGRLKVLARVLDADGSTPLRASLQVVAHPPIQAKDSKPTHLELKPASPRSPQWQGVLSGLLTPTNSGVWTIQVVAEGKGTNGPFRREATVTWCHQSARIRKRIR